MGLIKRLLMGIGAVAVVAGLTLSVPRAAHAVVATLVQVSNTSAAPAITQGVPNLASQMVLLVNSLGTSGNSGPFLSLSPQALLVSEAPYTTPATQNLVITSIQLAPFVGDVGTTLRLALSNASTGGEYGDWTVPGDSLTSLQFPTGIVVGPGVELKLVQIGDSSQAKFNVFIQGYLTAN